MARQLAADHGFRLYHTEPFSKYVARADPVATPLLHGFMAMDMDERWVNRPPEVMLETFHGFQGEGFDLVLDDLLALTPDPPVLAEGFSLLPRLVAPLLSRPQQAVWLLPTPEFRRAAFESRRVDLDDSEQDQPPAAGSGQPARPRSAVHGGTPRPGASVPAADH